jgi:DNA-binding PadR family transcriptional regulator
MMDSKKLTELEFLLLRVLAATGPTHPYHLGREVEQRGGAGFVSLGALYKALHRLEEAGYVESEWENVDARVAKRPKRRIYRILGLGEAAANAARATRAAFLRGALGGAYWP